MFILIHLITRRTETFIFIGNHEYFDRGEILESSFFEAYQILSICRSPFRKNQQRRHFYAIFYHLSSFVDEFSHIIPVCLLISGDEDTLNTSGDGSIERDISNFFFG